MRVYLDTSVLVSLYVSETHTDSIVNFLSGVDGPIFVSKLVETELYATLTKKIRTKELEPSKVKEISKGFTKHLNEGAFLTQLMSDAVFSTANQMLQDLKSNLRTLDALHLAAAKYAGCRLITADKTLAKSAELFKIQVHLV